MSRKLVFELLDIPYFSKPNILNIDLDATAAQLRRSKAGKSFMTYGHVFSQINGYLLALHLNKLLQQ